MKKILINSMLAGVLFTSCNLNEEPYGTLNDETALTTYENISKYRNGIYNNLRTMTGGAYVVYTDIQADMFIGVQDNGNRLGAISMGNFGSETTDMTGAWSSPYTVVMSVNYFLPYVESMLEQETTTEEQKANLIRYRGEAMWARAYSYYYLVDHYCQSYTLTNPEEEGSGVPLVTKYDPNGNYATYPGRSSLKASYELIEKDLEASYADLQAYEKTLSLGDRLSLLRPNANYLNTFVVQAFQARIALLKGDYEKAIEKAEAVIANTNYKLATRSNYSQMWTNDQSNELIFVLYGDQSQAGAISSMGSAWINANTELADYVAAANALAMYDAENDIRYDTFFEERSINVQGTYYYAPCFVKYPGNPDLNETSTNALKNLPKPFRLSEMYLILAEAAAETGDAPKANKALNDIRKNRIADYTEENYNGTILINEVRAERTKELIGEGHRISDLRRWNLGFTRSTDYPEEYKDVPDMLVLPGTLVTYSVGDYRYVWPIPRAEMESNPQLAGHQNPGYN